MNEQNLNYLKDGLKYLGFGEKLYGQLTEAIEAGQPTFSLNACIAYDSLYPKEGEKPRFNSVVYELQFKKGNNMDLYFFNSYHAKLTRFNGEEKEQTFYIDKNKGITAKESYNLLDGRAVNKDIPIRAGGTYNGWMQIDYSNQADKGQYKYSIYNENYGFDLEAALAKHPIKELTDGKKKEYLINGLKRGNIQEVTFLDGGLERKRFIEAAPRFKSLNLFSDRMEKILPVKKEPVKV